MRARLAAPVIALVLIGAAGLVWTGCSMVPLLRAMLGTRKPNRMIPGQLFANGGGSYADAGVDGVARASVERRPSETILHPSLIIMRNPGDLEITVTNRDPQGHLLIVAQSDGGQQALDVPPLEAGRALVHYGSPGMYLIADAMANQMGQGTMAFVVVQGEVPPGARLDRPAQRRP